MTNGTLERPIDVLLVDDNPGDVRLTREALRNQESRARLHVAADGEEALAFLHREGPYGRAPRPNLILLDLNLPKKDGREVLADIKGDPTLKSIPVIVLTTSEADRDIRRAYELHANCYVTKSADLDRFLCVVRLVEDFWMNTVKLPGGGD